MVACRPWRTNTVWNWRNKPSSIDRFSLGSRPRLGGGSSRPMGRPIPSQLNSGRLPPGEGYYGHHPCAPLGRLRSQLQPIWADPAFRPAPGAAHRLWLHEPFQAPGLSDQNLRMDHPGYAPDASAAGDLSGARAFGPAQSLARRVRRPLCCGYGGLCHQLCLLFFRDLPGRHRVHPQGPI